MTLNHIFFEIQHAYVNIEIVADNYLLQFKYVFGVRLPSAGKIELNFRKKSSFSGKIVSQMFITSTPHKIAL